MVRLKGEILHLEAILGHRYELSLVGTAMFSGASHQHLKTNINLTLAQLKVSAQANLGEQIAERREENTGENTHTIPCLEQKLVALSHFISINFAYQPHSV